MRLTTFTDYSLRTLMYLGARRDRLVTIEDIAATHAISKNHLMKVVHQLGTAGYIDTVRGRNGGLRLKMAPADINLGALVRATEPDFYMAECFGPGGSHCALGGSCMLKQALMRATAAYLAKLDQQTLAMLLPAEQGSAAPVTFQPPLAA